LNLSLLADLDEGARSELYCRSDILLEHPHHHLFAHGVGQHVLSRFHRGGTLPHRHVPHHRDVRSQAGGSPVSIEAIR